jgi:hypothetical protein
MSSSNAEDGSSTKGPATKRSRQDMRREANRVNAKKSRLRKKAFVSDIQQQLAIIQQQNAIVSKDRTLPVFRFGI